jgi:hypothetical protein
VALRAEGGATTPPRPAGGHWLGIMISADIDRLARPEQQQQQQQRGKRQERLRRLQATPMGTDVCPTTSVATTVNNVSTAAAGAGMAAAADQSRGGRGDSPTRAAALASAPCVPRRDHGGYDSGGGGGGINRRQSLLPPRDCAPVEQHQRRDGIRWGASVRYNLDSDGFPLHTEAGGDDDRSGGSGRPSHRAESAEAAAAVAAAAELFEQALSNHAPPPAATADSRATAGRLRPGDDPVRPHHNHPTPRPSGWGRPAAAICCASPAAGARTASAAAAEVVAAAAAAAGASLASSSAAAAPPPLLSSSSRPAQQPQPEAQLYTVRQPFAAEREDDLQLALGERVVVTNARTDRHWWRGVIRTADRGGGGGGVRTGIFPRRCVRLVDGADGEAVLPPEPESHESTGGGGEDWMSRSSSDRPCTAAERAAAAELSGVMLAEGKGQAEAASSLSGNDLLLHFLRATSMRRRPSDGTLCAAQLLRAHLHWRQRWQPAAITADDCGSALGCGVLQLLGGGREAGSVVLLLQLALLHPAQHGLGPFVRTVVYVMRQASEAAAIHRVHKGTGEAAGEAGEPKMVWVVDCRDAQDCVDRAGAAESLEALVDVVQNQYPAWFHRCLLVNASQGVRVMWRALKSLVATNIQSKVEILDSCHQLRSVMPVHLLPARYGGTCPDTVYL